jgi:hypothetical protein
LRHDAAAAEQRLGAEAATLAEADAGHAARADTASAEAAETAEAVRLAEADANRATEAAAEANARVQTASQTLAQKAIAAGFTGEQVDGNDVIAMRAAADEAIANARSGGGPRLIEAVTYRLGDHTTADDAGRYRPPEEVQAHWKEEPIARLRAYLVGRKAWGKAEEEKLAAECQREVDAAIEPDDVPLFQAPLPRYAVDDLLVHRDAQARGIAFVAEKGRAGAVRDDEAMGDPVELLRGDALGHEGHELGEKPRKKTAGLADAVHLLTVLETYHDSSDERII